MLKDNLKKLRTAHNLTKKQIASAVGLTERQYITYEYGEREPSIDAIITLAKFYGVSTDYLLGIADSGDGSTPLDRLAEEENLGSMERTILEQYFTLTPEQRAVFVDFMKKTVEAERQKQELEYDEYTMGELEDAKEKGERLG